MTKFTVFANAIFPRCLRTCPRWWGASPDHHRYSDDPRMLFSLNLIEDHHRICILGSGNIGCFVAHSLRTLLAPPPVALLFHMYSSLQRFFPADSTIQVQRLHKELSSSKGFNYELPPSPLTSDAAPDAESPDNNDNKNSLLEQVVLLPPSAPPPPPEHIAILVITTKAPQTVAALRPISKRLTRDSTILILQNGMEVEERRRRWRRRTRDRSSSLPLAVRNGTHTPPAPAQKTRMTPRCWNPFLRRRRTSSLCSSLPRDWPPRTSRGAAVGTIGEARRQRGHKPAHRLMDCRNRELLSNYYVVQTMRIVLWEVS